MKLPGQTGLKPISHQQIAGSDDFHMTAKIEFANQRLLQKEREEARAKEYRKKVSLIAGNPFKILLSRSTLQHPPTEDETARAISQMITPLPPVNDKGHEEVRKPVVPFNFLPYSLTCAFRL